MRVLIWWCADFGTCHRNPMARPRGELCARCRVRREVGARVAKTEAMIAPLQLLIAKLRCECSGCFAERGRRLLDQLEPRLEGAKASAREEERAAQAGRDRITVRGFTAGGRAGAVAAHLPRKRSAPELRRLPVPLRRAR
jgi:hypothetical protein